MKENKLSFKSIIEYFENYLEEIDIIEINSKVTVCAILHYMNEIDGININALTKVLKRDHPKIKLNPGVFYKSLEMLKTNNYIQFEKKSKKARSW